VGGYDEEMKNAIKILDQNTIELLKKNSRLSTRKRSHFFLHESYSDPVQRFYNAMQPKTYICPHKHTKNDAWELFVIIAGEAAVLIFDEFGTILERVGLGKRYGVYLVEIPPNLYHSIACLQEDTLLVEFKHGAYDPLTDKCFADWAPREGDADCVFFENWFCKAHAGQNIVEVEVGISC